VLILLLKDRLPIPPKMYVNLASKLKALGFICGCAQIAD